MSTSHLNGCAKRIDAHGKYVLPGFIDLHSDAIEKEVEPGQRGLSGEHGHLRDGQEAGGMRHYHHVPFGVLRSKATTSGRARRYRIIREINRLAPKLNVRTRVHARFEIRASRPSHTWTTAERGRHTPFLDHGPYPRAGPVKDLGSISEDIPKVLGLDDTALTRSSIAAQGGIAAADGLIWKACRPVPGIGIPVASHDDDT